MDEKPEPIHPVLRAVIIMALVVGVGFYAWVAATQVYWP